MSRIDYQDYHPSLWCCARGRAQGHQQNILLGPILYAAKRIQIDNAGIAIVKRRDQDHKRYDDADVDPFVGISQQVQDQADDEDARNGDAIAYVHGALVETGLGFQPHTAVRAGVVHFIKVGELRNRIRKNISLPATGALTED